ncbi:serine hydrolase domain-containing protein [Ornithinibacillus contaminans]|uniref:serine hydrolase domain-containing protein n=1 Tax=Ornithinibacillus contaminans TaxID=694055 RepID=UPI00064D8456|nr:serine hydrolase [Ornithinibacillus contaminans]
MGKSIEKIITEVASEVGFSGAIQFRNKDEFFEAAYGYSNRSDQVANTVNTRFGIASGCKIFTAVGIGLLVDQGKLSFQTSLKDCLDISFPNFSEDVTIHHLLTHTAGIPDYFDESVMDDFEELWINRPMYTMRHLQDFLFMFQDREMLFQPGEKFQYNNAGYIVLGLVIEQVTGMSFTDFIEENVFRKAKMHQSGYFSLDQLPANTAIGYIDDEETGQWKSNLYSIPVKGGADGGAFITAGDMMNFWEALFANELLTKETTETLLTPHANSNRELAYGYGIWISMRDNEITKYHVMGYDPGVNFRSAVYLDGAKVVIASNKNDGAFSIMKAIEEFIGATEPKR